MKNKKLILILCLLFSANLFGASLSETSQEIHNTINSLKIEIKDLQNDLGKMEILNGQQSEDIIKLQNEKLELSVSLDDTITKLEEYSNTITEQTLKLKTRAKVIFILGIILVVMIIIKIVIMILKVKCNINLPYWLNCIL